MPVSTARRLARAAAAGADRLAAAAVLGLLALAVGTAADVAGRYLFATPIRGFNDLVPLAGAVLLAACMPHVVARRGHIVVDALGQRLGPRAERALNAFGALLTTLFFVLMGWQYVRYAAELRDTGDVMPILRWPVWPWWAAVAACIVTTAVVGALTLGLARTDATGVRPDGEGERP